MTAHHLHLTVPGTCGILAGACLALAAPAFAQTAEEITVLGRYGAGAEVRSLSQVVSYADLDLGTKAGQDMLRHRISLTARYLCDKLGESNTSSAGIPSCRDQATRDAQAQVNTVVAHWAPRGTTWVAGPAWVAPYPSAWVETYP